MVFRTGHAREVSIMQGRPETGALCRGILAVLVLGGSLLAAQAGSSATLTGAVNGGTRVAISPDRQHRAWLTALPVQHLASPNDDEMAWLRQAYGTWTFARGAAATGSFNILQYAAFATSARGGADFAVLYEDGVAAARTDYNWVQIGYPTRWGDKDSMPFIDSIFSNSPFYGDLSPIHLPTALTPTGPFFGSSIWLSADYPQSHIQNPVAAGRLPAGDLILQDEPWCRWTCLKGGESSSISFNTYLVSFTWNGRGGREMGGDVVLHDGFHWGVAIPAPASLSLLAFGCLALGLARGGTPGAAAVEWSVPRGTPLGRVAWQFVQDLAGRLGVRIAA
jgi:hypothetical protein